MEMYQEAYDYYMTKCETFGVIGIDFNQFMNNITEDQVKIMLNKSN